MGGEGRGRKGKGGGAPGAGAGKGASCRGLFGVTLRASQTLALPARESECGGFGYLGVHAPVAIVP